MHGPGLDAPVEMSTAKPAYSDSFASDKDASSDEYYLGTKVRVEPLSEPKERPEAALGDAVLRFLRIRKGARVDLDSVSGFRVA